MSAEMEWCPVGRAWVNGGSTSCCARPSQHTTNANWRWSGLEFAHPITMKHRLPVAQGWHSAWNADVPVALVLPREGVPFQEGLVMPDENELETLGLYRLARLARWNRKFAIEKMLDEPIDIDRGVNTYFLGKHGTKGWQYRKATWEIGAFLYPAPDSNDVYALNGLLAAIEDGDWRAPLASLND